MAHMIRLVVDRTNAVRLRAIAEHIAAAKPATEILLLGASREAADDLARSSALLPKAQFGLHRMSWRQLVGQLAASSLADAGLAPASSLSTEAIAARAAFQARSKGQIPRLSKVSHFPGFPRALASTLVELQEAALTAKQLTSQQELAILLARFEKNIDEAAVAPYPALLDHAQLGLQHPHLRAIVQRPLILMDLDLQSTREFALMQQICAIAPVVLVTSPEADAALLEALEQVGTVEMVPVRSHTAARKPTCLTNLKQHLFSDSIPKKIIEDDTVHFFSAPGEGRESIEIVRLILDALQHGIRFDEIAVFPRAPEIYSSLLDTAFRRAEIPAYFARGSRRPDPAGRAFLALLTCATEQLSAKRFAEYLAFSQVPKPDAQGHPPEGGDTWAAPRDELLGNANVAGAAGKGGEAYAPTVSAQRSLWDTAAEPPSTSLSMDSDDDSSAPTREGTLQAPWKWEEYLVEAAVIGSRQRWERRIRGLANELRLKATELANTDPQSARLPMMQRDLDQLGHLERFALPIIETLDQYPAECTWGEWIAHLSSLAPRVLRAPRRVLSVLQELSPMAAIGPTSLAEVKEVLSTRLATMEAEPPSNRYGRVFVGPPDLSRGRTFRMVFVPGLAERIFPQRPREDPLLLDAARRTLKARLRTQEVRAHHERLLLRLAVGAAEERIVLSYPRIDAAEARPRVPSFYGLDVIRATQGALPDFEEFERQAAAQVQARLAWPAPVDPMRSIDAVEHDLAVIGPLLHAEAPERQRGKARYLLDLNEHLARSLRVRWQRWSRRWTPADGIVRVTDATRPLLEREDLDKRPYSVTALQRFSTCPYQFLLSSIHRLEPRREAIALAQMDPLTRGRLFHEIQARTLAELRERKLIPFSKNNAARCRELLDATVLRVAQIYQDDLAPPILRVWQDEVDTVRADLRIWLDNLADQKEWRPIHFELAFGLPAQSTSSGPRDPASRPEPAILPDGWLLRGVIDLVEESVDGSTLRVTDHKTGINRTMPGMTLAGGEILQPLLYGLALESILGKPVTEGRLSFCTSRGQFSEHVIPLGPMQRNWAAFALELIHRCIKNGILPPAPREQACRFCDFRIVCGPHEERRSQNKNQALLEHLNQLRDLQ